MIDIILASDFLFQMHAVVNRSKNVFLCDVLWNQLMDIFMDCFLKSFLITSIHFIQDTTQYRIVYKLGNAHLLQLFLGKIREPLGCIHFK